VEALAEQGLVGIAVLNSKSFVVHHGASKGTDDAMVYGTNPMAFAFPRPDGLPPLVWDQVRVCPWRCPAGSSGGSANCLPPDVRW